jgi:GTP-dependent dephospho-CoA kinase
LIQFRPNPSDLPRLKNPFGKLIPGEPSKTMPELKKLLGQTRPSRVTAVGDVVSRETLAAGISVDLRIIDRISMRKPTAQFNVKAQKTYHVTNPPGVITMGSWDVIKKAMKEHDALILVDGEEDLLTLPCIVESPEHGIVLYGQPSQGLIVVTITSEIKKEASQILDRMTKEEANDP